MAVDLLTLPIPPAPSYYGPDGAPPGVDLALDAYDTLDDGFKWVDSRPVIKPICLVNHTNAASREGTLISSIRWGQRVDTGDGRNSTKPHYCINWPRPAKTLRTDLRAIANSTTSEIEQQYGVADSSFWTIAIESADMGSIAALAAGIAWPTDCGPYLEDSFYGDVEVPHAEIIARIIAYESIVWGFPVVEPDEFGEPGCVAHTDPFPYPYFTTRRGKTCPGTTKKRQLRDEIYPRARMLRDAWLNNEPPGGDTVFYRIEQAQNIAFRMKGFNDVVAIVDGTPQPVTQQNAFVAFGINTTDLGKIVNDPIPHHAETVAWLRAQGIAMSPSQGGV